jgi:hypothetical protein
MSEGLVWLCGWSEKDGQYTVWVKSHPEVRAVGPNLDDANLKLSDEICGRFGDGEAALEFDPPRPVASQNERYLREQLVKISPNGGFDTRMREETLFSGGICSECGWAVGTRTVEPLIGDTGVGYEGASPMVPAHMVLFSERFLSLLTEKEKAALELREVIRPPRSKIKFYEVIPRTFVPYVGVRGRKPSGWYCGTCGYRCYSYYDQGWDVTCFVCRRDLPRPIPSLFAVGSERDVNLCMPRKRWREILGHREARGIMSHNLGVVDEHECERTPELPRRGHAKGKRR